MVFILASHAAVALAGVFIGAAIERRWWRRSLKRVSEQVNRAIEKARSEILLMQSASDSPTRRLH